MHASKEEATKRIPLEKELWPFYQVYSVTLTLDIWINIDVVPTSNFHPIRILVPGCWHEFKYWLDNSEDQDQLASSEANWSGSTLLAKRQGIFRIQQDKS